MERRFANNITTTITKDGKETTMAYCDICGKPYKTTDYGFDISLKYCGGSAGGRLALCGACSKEIAPIIIKAMDDVFEKKEEMRDKAIKDGTYREIPRLGSSITEWLDSVLSGRYGFLEEDEE